MESNATLVSIIVPMYNTENYIEAFILSVQMQTETNWELLIIDDGSSDKSIEIVKAYSAVDDRIHLLKRNRLPKGSVTCRNIGQEYCNGKYFMHLDSDDVLATFALEQRVKFMNEHPDVDFATAKGKSVTIDKNGNLHETGRCWGINPHKNLLDCFLSVNYPFSVWNNIYRTSSFADYRWDEKVKIYTDFSFIVPTLIGSYKHAFIEDSKADYFYRIGLKNAMTSNFISDDKYESTKYLFTKTMDMIHSLSNYQKHKKAFEKFFLLQLERVAIDGSQEQIDDFVEYYARSYSEKKNVKLCLLYKSILKNCKKKSYSSRIIRLWIYVLFKPALLCRLALHIR